MRKLTLLVAGLLMLASCSGAPSEQAEAEPVVPDGFKLYDGSADGFMIALPASWLILNDYEIDRDAQLDAMEAAGEIDPEAAQTLRDVLKSMPAESPYALEAAHVVDGFPSVNVIAMEGRSEPGLLDTMEAEISSMAQQPLGAPVSFVGREECGGAPCLHTTMAMEDVTGQPGQLDQYLVFADDRGLTITFASADPEADRDVFDAVMETLTLVG